MGRNFTGSNYKSGLWTKDIAKLVRDETKLYSKAFYNLYQIKTKFSVRYESFSGGSAIRISLTDCNVNPFGNALVKMLLDQVTDYCQSYNRDDSDAMFDHFDVNFYDGRAKIDYQLENQYKNVSVIF